MGLFSKKITTDNISDTLIKFFEANYGFLVVGFKDKLEEKNISNEQDKELVAVSMFPIIHVVLAEFGASSITKNILGRFQHKIIKAYFKNSETREDFVGLLGDRGNEYNKILTAGDEDVVIQLGQIFCNHYYRETEGRGHSATMILVGSTFLNLEVNTKKFLDEVTLKFTIY